MAQVNRLSGSVRLLPNGGENDLTRTVAPASGNSTNRR